MPSLRRTSTGTEICPCAVTFDRAITIPNITMVMEHAQRASAPPGLSRQPPLQHRFAAAIGEADGEVDSDRHRHRHAQQRPGIALQVRLGALA